MKQIFYTDRNISSLFPDMDMMTAGYLDLCSVKKHDDCERSLDGQFCTRCRKIVVEIKEAK